MQKQQSIVIYSWKRFIAAMLVFAALVSGITGFCVSRAIHRQYDNEFLSQMVSMSDSAFNC